MSSKAFVVPPATAKVLDALVQTSAPALSAHMDAIVKDMIRKSKVVGRVSQMTHVTREALKFDGLGHDEWQQAVNRAQRE